MILVAVRRVAISEWIVSVARSTRPDPDCFTLDLALYDYAERLAAQHIAATRP